MTMTAPDTALRGEWMGLLATADPARLAALWSEFGDAPAHEVLRPPEIGTALVRGRAGGIGAAFNLGEISVTRCSIALADGTVGHGYVQGRDRQHATVAALVDALMQTGAAPVLKESLLAPLAADRQARRSTRAAKADATRVEFFTMVRGEVE